MSLVGSTKGVRFLGCLSWVLPLGMCLMFAFGGSGQCFWRFANWAMGWNGWRQVGHTCLAVNCWFVEFPGFVAPQSVQDSSPSVSQAQPSTPKSPPQSQLPSEPRSTPLSRNMNSWIPWMPSLVTEIAGRRLQMHAQRSYKTVRRMGIPGTVCAVHQAQHGRDVGSAGCSACREYERCSDKNAIGPTKVCQMPQGKC